MISRTQECRPWGAWGPCTLTAGLAAARQGLSWLAHRAGSRTAPVEAEVASRA